MTALPNSHLISTGELLVELVVIPFRAIGNAVIAMAERHPRYKAVEKLNAMSDEQLAEKGLTRVEAVRQILGTYY